MVLLPYHHTLEIIEHRNKLLIINLLPVIRRVFLAITSIASFPLGGLYSRDIGIWIILTILLQTSPDITQHLSLIGNVFASELICHLVDFVEWVLLLVHFSLHRRN